MDRRTLLLSLLALAGSQTACQSEATQTLRVAALKSTLPPPVITAFRQQLPPSVRLKIDIDQDIAALFQRLQNSRNPAAAKSPKISLPIIGSSRSQGLANWVSLGDYWLQAAIAQQLIQPLPTDTIPGLSQLPAAWTSLLRRDRQGFPVDDGPLWATPYRWGTLAMVYSHRTFKELGWQPTHWKDLWRDDLTGRIALPNHPRLTLGIALKSLGYSANDVAPQQHSDFVTALDKLPQQVKIYASVDYIQPLIQGDIALAVGWAADIRPLVTQYQQLRAIVPNPGTLLSADVWVSPTGNAAPYTPAVLTEVDQQWLTYWWQSETQDTFSRRSDGLSPLLLRPETQVAAELTAETLLLPNSAQLNQSEFLYPLSESAVEEYTALWKQLRGVK